MRRRYPITNHPQPSPSIHSRPDPRVAGRISIVAIQEEIQHPARHPAHRGPAVARRLKIVRIEQSTMLSDGLEDARAPFSVPALTPSHVEAAAPRRALSPPRTLPSELECWLEGKSVRLRRVGGMVRDEAGNFYEVDGEQLRPLGELVTDEHGGIFEIQSASEVKAAEDAKEKPSFRPSGQGHAKPVSKNGDSRSVETQSQPARSQAVQAAASSPYRKIVADPGLYLKITWARIKNELTTHLKHPERLRDDDVIECYAQIYEAQRTLSASELAALEWGDASLASQFHPLTQNRAQVLGVPQLYKPVREPFETRGAGKQIHAGQRVFCLWPVFDPTVERAKPSEPVAKPEDSATTPRHQIPHQFLNPLQFKYSREEVLYDMKSMLGTLPPEEGALMRWFFIYPQRLLIILVTLVTSRRRMKKWRAILECKNLDEQLWAVTPPRSFPYHPSVRRWAEEGLARAGYDPKRMFLEWEIFWRRKGLN
jgi:hypothetical protein